MQQRPSKKTILERMLQMIGTPYVWGGNWNAGIPEMLIYYPPTQRLNPSEEILWTLKGVDCSGLLFEASNGTTPRNTSELLYFGNPVPIDEQLMPLDMLLYPGHIAFVVDAHTTIESKFPFGVIQRNLSERLWEYAQARTRVNDWSSDLNPRNHFVIRRFQ